MSSLAHGVTLAAVLLQPESRGHIRLADPDPAEPPLIDPTCSPRSGTCTGMRLAAESAS